MFGKLTLEAFKHEASQNFAVIMMLLTGIGIIGLISYLKRWKWLWNEWLTSVDPKRIGIMYIIVVSHHVLQRICRCPHDASSTSSFCRRFPWLYFRRPLSRSLFCPWHDHDFFRRHGGCLWPHESHCPFANWSQRCCLSLFKCPWLLAFCIRRHA